MASDTPRRLQTVHSHLCGNSGPDHDGRIAARIKEFDTPTVFNATTRVLGHHGPVDFAKWHSDFTVRHLMPGLGSFCGFAVTAQVTTNDDVEHIEFGELWAALEAAQATSGRPKRPLVTVIQDIDSRPGRGAAAGDGMARNQRFYGVVGCVIEGTVRDVAAIERVGLPTVAWGAVPGHGPFLLQSVNKPVSVGGMVIQPGELIFADADGVTRVPVEHAETIIAVAGEIRRWEAEVFEFFQSSHYSPCRAATILPKLESKYPLLLKYPSFNGSKGLRVSSV